MSLRELHFLERKGKRLVLFPLPLQGHLIPMLQLANILYSKGFSITLIHTDFNSPNPSNYPHFTFRSIPDGISDQSQPSPEDPVVFNTLLNANCSMPFRNCLSELLSLPSQEPIVCLIADAIWTFSQAVADSLSLPRIVLRPSSVRSFLAWDAFPFLRQMGYLPQQETELEKPVKEVPPLKVKDLPIIKTANTDGFYDLLLKMMKDTKSSSGIIWNTFQDLEHSALLSYPTHFPIPVFAIGPFHQCFPHLKSSSSTTTLLTHDHSAIPWLNTQPPDSVLYVSFGSISIITEADLLEIAWGLANSHHPFLWVIRPGSVCGCEWCEPLPKGLLESVEGRGHIGKWAPQLEVLSHGSVGGGGVWTHNGWNSTMESICEGVPMICSPSFGDQMVNARYVSDVWKVGVHLEGKLERGEIEKAIRKVMDGTVRKEMKERMDELKKKAKQCLMVGGSSYQSLQSLVDRLLSF